MGPTVRLWLVGLIAGWLTSSPARGAEVNLRVTDQPVEVAQPIWLEVEVTAPAGSKLGFPEPGEILGDFEVLDVRDVGDIPLAEEPQRRRWIRRFLIESLLTGPRQVPPLEVTVTPSSGDGETVLRTDPVTIQVTSVLEDRTNPTQFRDIDSVMDPPPTPRSANLEWMWWAGGLAAGIAVLTAAAVVLMRRVRRRSPNQWAVRQLAELETATGRGEHSTDAALSRMSEILETLVQHAATAEPMDAARDERVREALRTSDQARFAGRQLSPQQTAEILRAVREWITVYGEST